MSSFVSENSSLNNIPLTKVPNLEPSFDKPASSDIKNPLFEFG